MILITRNVIQTVDLVGLIILKKKKINRTLWGGGGGGGIRKTQIDLTYCSARKYLKL